MFVTRVADAMYNFSLHDTPLKSPCIGSGVEIAPSLIQIDGSGCGLFTSRRFPKGSVVTWYDGVLLWATRVLDQKRGKYNDKTHWRAVQGMDMVIQGLRSVGDGDLTGRGGGSIINHDLDRQNCKIMNSSHHILMWCESDHLFHRIVAVVIEATRDIEAFEELYCDYGSGVWIHDFFDRPLP